PKGKRYVLGFRSGCAKRARQGQRDGNRMLSDIHGFLLCWLSSSGLGTDLLPQPDVCDLRRVYDETPSPRLLEMIQCVNLPGHLKRIPIDRIMPTFDVD